MHDTIKLDIFIFTWWYALNLIIRIVICQLLLNTLGNSVLQNPTLSMCFCAIFPPLCNLIIRQVIMLKSCSNAENMQQVFWMAMKEYLEVLYFRFFVGDVISGLFFGHFGSDYLALDPNH